MEKEKQPKAKVLVEVDAQQALEKINEALEQVNQARKTLKSIDLDDFDIETGGHK